MVGPDDRGRDGAGPGEERGGDGRAGPQGGDLRARLPGGDRRGPQEKAGAEPIDRWSDDPALPPGLTPAQRQAVVAPDPLVSVLAGAGAGKTRVLTLRVAWRVHHTDMEPDRVLVCTFSRKAAEELSRRLRGLQVGAVRAGTFHRTALSLLRQHRADRGLPAPSLLPDRRSLLATIVPDSPPPGREAGARRAPRTGRGPRPALVAQLDTEIGWAKARLVRPADYAPAARRHGRRTVLPGEQIAELFERYEAARRRQRALDFDDLLTICADVLHEDVAFADAVRWRFRHLFVDEMQDVNPAQFRLLAALLGDEPDLMVVGDPNQSVYGWNGADPTLIDRLPELLPGMRVIRLDENHRCTPQVVTVASAALGLDNSSGRTGTDRRAGPRSTRPDGPIPRVVPHETDRDEADWVAREVWLSRPAGHRWSDVAILARTNAQLTAFGEALDRGRVPYRQAGSDLGPASDLRESSLRWRDEPHAPEWPTLDSRERETEERGPGDEDDDRVVLTTFHRAKGLQWPSVFVVGLSAGLVPLASARDEAAMAEERRLLYVALTRAEEHLTCTWARFRDAEETGAPRKASPWLEAVGRATERLRRYAAPLGAIDTASRVTALRARLLSEPAPHPGTSADGAVGGRSTR